MLEFGVTAAGDVIDFDADVFKVWLATNVEGEDSITLNVAAGSVTVTALIIFTGDTAEADASTSAAWFNTLSVDDLSEALEVTVESIMPATVSSTRLGAPPPSPPQQLIPTMTNETEASIKTDSEYLTITIGAEWYVLGGGILSTAFLLAFGAYSRAKARLKFTEIVSTLIASADAFTDIAFAAHQLISMQSPTEHIFALLLLFFLVVPTACASTQIAHALRSPSLEMHNIAGNGLQELSAYYALVLLISLTNVEVLRVLPWRKGTAIFDGLPDRRLMVRMWLMVTFLEDIPQFCLQLILTRECSRDITCEVDFLAPLSLSLTVIAVIWRALRKAIYLAPAATTTQTSLAINARLGQIASGANVLQFGRNTSRTRSLPAASTSVSGAAIWSREPDDADHYEAIETIQQRVSARIDHARAASQGDFSGVTISPLEVTSDGLVRYDSLSVPASGPIQVLLCSLAREETDADHSQSADLTAISQVSLEQAPSGRAYVETVEAVALDTVPAVPVSTPARMRIDDDGTSSPQTLGRQAGAPAGRLSLSGRRLDFSGEDDESSDAGRLRSNQPVPRLVDMTAIDMMQAGCLVSDLGRVLPSTASNLMTAQPQPQAEDEDDDALAPPWMTTHDAQHDAQLRQQHQERDTSGAQMVRL